MPTCWRARSISTWPGLGWAPTVDTYLGRVTKARILQAVREAKGAEAAERIATLKKGEMAEQAEALLAGSGWLPEPLRTPGGAAHGSEGQVLDPVPDAEAPEDGGAGEVPAAEDQWPAAAE